MAKVNIEEILALPVADRIALVQEILDSLADEADAFALSDAQRQEIERRMADHDAHPDEALDWEDVRRELRRGA